MWLLVVGLILLGSGFVHSATNAPAPTPQVIAVQGTNWWLAPVGAQDFVLASTRVPQNLRSGDRVRTGEDTRLFVQTPHLGVIQIPPLSTVEISVPPAEPDSLAVRLLQGVLYFFHRGEARDLEVHTESASAAIRGTEFVAEAWPDGGLSIRMLDGLVELSNDQGRVTLQRGEQGTATPNRPPRQEPLTATHTTVQWFLHYPAVLNPDELDFDETTRERLRDSLTAYRAGDFLRALATLPPAPTVTSPQAHLYRAALRLTVGHVEPVLAILQNQDHTENQDPSLARATRALRLMMAAMGRDGSSTARERTHRTAGEWLAASYLDQSQAQLADALAAAREAIRLTPDFGPAWARVAELEFGFGRFTAAESALQTALELSPRHAPAMTLRGFLHAARNQHDAASASFDAALALDAGLGDAWLGRGLESMHRGNVETGLRELEVAAALEPQRAIYRAYLAKAFASAGFNAKAMHELSLAKSLDPNDPTAWLYEALLAQQQNRINHGIQNLETSQRLNDERAIYRSRHLLDQDQAVRGANLAALYRDAGMMDVARQEAVDAVHTDYANASAHLFLANAYNELRDPGQIDLRYETPWFTEYLLANLLAPAGAGTLSPMVSQQEYSRLFDRRQLGIVSQTEYRSGGDWIQSGAHYGVMDGLAYAVEEDYRTVSGQRPNHDLEQLTLSLRLQQQLGLDDSLYFQATYYDAKGGDLSRVYDPDDPAFYRPNLRYEENQEPILLAGYHHRWNPQHHSLLLAGRLHDETTVTDPTHPVLIVSEDPSGQVTGTVLTSAEHEYRSTLEIYTVEAQHIAALDPLTLIVGSRYQVGSFETESRLQNLSDQSAALPEPLRQEFRPDMDRFTAYAYGQWNVVDPLTLFGGLSYDSLQYPANHRYAPLARGEESAQAVSPKGGLVWKPFPSSTLRAAYTRSLGGVSLEQSVRLEPSQVAGFNQAFRSLIPESSAGSTSGARLELGSLEWDQRFPSRTYFNIRGDAGRSRVNRDVGIFDLPFLAEAGTAREHLDFEEKTLRVSLHQLVGDDWSFGAQYRLSHAELNDAYPHIPASADHSFEPYQLQPRRDLESVLQQVKLFALLNHESGFFAQADALWTQQSNRGYSPDRPGDDFWHFNVWAGYRFAQRKVELRFGILNLTDRDYRMSPLNLTAELPRDRTFTAALRLSL